MSVIHKIAYHQNRRDEVPNQELAKELAESENTVGLQEMVDHLYDKNKSISSDCLKVIYETGYIRPDLIAPFVPEFMKLLESKINRMVWGSMIALANTAPLNPKPVLKEIEKVISTFQKGTLITQVWGLNTIANAIATDPTYNKKYIGVLFDHIEKCNPRELPRHTQDILAAINDSNREALEAIIMARIDELNKSQYTKLKRILKKVEITI